MTNPPSLPYVSELWAETYSSGAVDGQNMATSFNDMIGLPCSVQGSPKYLANFASSGKPAFSFPSQDAITFVPTFASTATVTAIIIGRLQNIAGADFLDHDGSTDNGAHRLVVDSSGTQWRLYSGGTQPAGGATDLLPHLFVATFNISGADTLEVDTVQVINADSGSNPPGDHVSIGSTLPDNGGHHGSEVAFAGLVDRALTDTEKASVYSWYQQEYLGVAPPPPARTGQPKIWNGTAWVNKPLKVWDGSAWNEKPVYGYDGTEWVLSK